jgi:L-alanine-DL-glutamate epimerase-like enolase superfamily enzyme
MSIRIRSIETRIFDHRLRQDRIIRSHAGTHDTSRFLTVVASDADGLCGYGEAATTPLWSGESAETAQVVIRQILAPVLTNRTLENPREAVALMEKACLGNPFAKAGVDAAVWDLYGRVQGISATKLFADREPVLSIPTRASVGAYPPEETVRIATAFWKAGIRTLKFKIGVPGIDDAARLRAVREALGDEPVFTVDANAAYATADIALNALEALLPFRLALIEQPTPRNRFTMLADVRKRLRIPMMADELIFTPADLDEALDCDAFDILSVYPGKNGGITSSIEMAKTAQQASKTCAIGSNLETDLGQAAMAAIAAGLSAFPIETLACDLGAAMFYERSSVKQPLVLKNGRIEVPNGPGFGVEPA